ncbi:hypothetical protein SDC9_136727 [bioreactor metagenome]|uniref:Uncharacterized protein n=1 Tax=bioreactor metagenome TaxID=1076179 RepID=A0A645DK19_9ZZZZ
MSDSLPVIMGARMARTAIMTTAKNESPISTPTVITNGTETLENFGTCAELNNTSAPAMKVAVPTIVSAPWVGALISKIKSTKATPIKMSPT